MIASASVAAASVAGTTSGCTAAIGWQQARLHVGQVATVQGRVASTKYAATSNGAPTFLDVGRPYPDPDRFTVVIWGSDRPRFGSPEARYAGQLICVRGTISEYGGGAEMEVTDPAQITLAAAASQPSPPAASASTGSAPDASTSSSGANCGVERWAIKTLIDPAARSVNWTPATTTVGALRRLAPPSTLGRTTRIPPVETTTWRVTARLVGFKTEADSDIHLVIADVDTGGTMIVEFPASSCVGAAAPTGARAQMQAAKRALISACAVPGSRYTHLAGTATITGVGFWDFKHGQTGVAPNAIELHPVLSFKTSACTVR